MMMTKHRDSFTLIYQVISFQTAYIVDSLIDVNYCVQLIIGIISHSFANANHTIFLIRSFICSLV